MQMLFYLAIGLKMRPCLHSFPHWESYKLIMKVVEETRKVPYPVLWLGCEEDGPHLISTGSSA